MSAPDKQGPKRATNSHPSRVELAKTHIAKKDLGIDDDEYRAILWSRYKKRFAAKLTLQPAWDLVAHFKRLGWRPRPPRAKTD